MNFIGNRDAARASELRKSPGPCFFNMRTRAAKKEGTIMLGVALQDRHHEDKALEILKRQYGMKFGIPAAITRQLVNAAGESKGK